MIYKRSHPAFASNFDRAVERMMDADRNAAAQPKCRHENRECTYESDDGEFERWQCKDCGERWGVEIAQ